MLEIDKINTLVKNYAKHEYIVKCNGCFDWL